VVFLTNGVTWLRNWIADAFPAAVCVLDFYHLMQHVYGFAEAFFAEKQAAKPGQKHNANRFCKVYIPIVAPSQDKFEITRFLLQPHCIQIILYLLLQLMYEMIVMSSCQLFAVCVYIFPAQVRHGASAKPRMEVNPGLSLTNQLLQSIAL
jgi:hypothetical protein